MMAARREKKAYELGTWVRKALPGEQLVYVRGVLALKPFEGRGALSLWSGGTACRSRGVVAPATTAPSRYAALRSASGLSLTVQTADGNRSV